MMKANRAILGVFIVGAILAGMFWAWQLEAKKKIIANQFHGTLLERPRQIAAFSLTGIDEKAFTVKSLEGRWTFVFFGFTNCGYLCPTTMAELAKMYQLLEMKKTNPLPQVVMVSIDPEQDSLEKLNDYVKAFHPSFYGAKGSSASVRAITHELGIVYTKIKALNTNKYDIQHTGAVMAFNPKGELAAFFTTPHQASLLAEDYLLLLSS